MLNLILPQSLRCPADPYFTQVATHYPHLHRQGEDVHYGHFEDTPTEVQDERIHRYMRNTPHHCSGYRAIHWTALPYWKGPIICSGHPSSTLFASPPLFPISPLVASTFERKAQNFFFWLPS